jgi:beta-D-xylosidase 4
MNFKFWSLNTVLLLCATAEPRHVPIQRRQNGTCLPAPPTPEPYTAETRYLSCYTDQGTPRTLGAVEYDSNLNTPRYCADNCGNAGYSFAGVEYSRYSICSWQRSCCLGMHFADIFYLIRSQCFCANTINPVASPANESSCNSPCSGNSSQTCGQSNL